MSLVVPRSEALEAAGDVLDAGGVIVLPTDTVYGIAVRLDRPVAVERIFQIKQRPRDKAIAVLVGSIDQAKMLAVFDDAARSAAAEGWPGANTFVLRRSATSDIASDLGGDATTIGLRVPDDDLCLKLIGRCGPLAATSANPSGEQVLGDIDAMVATLPGVDLFIDGGPSSSRPSAVISFVNGRHQIR